MKGSQTVILEAIGAPMDINTQKFANWIILGIGLLGFLILLSQNEFTIAISILLSSLIFWIGYSLLMEDEPDFKTFSFVFTGAGLLVSLAIFSHFGVEKVAYPKGAIQFHSNGIAIALAVILFTLIPAVMVKAISGTKILPSIPNNIASQKTQTPPKSMEKEIYIDDDIWEEATEEDLISGEYEEE